MTWTYSIEWFPGGGAAAAASKNIVVVTSKPRSRTDSELIRTAAWTAEAHDANRTAVTAYVSVTRGGMPVLGARVKMSLKIGGRTVREAEMLDDGYAGEEENDFYYAETPHLDRIIYLPAH